METIGIHKKKSAPHISGVQSFMQPLSVKMTLSNELEVQSESFENGMASVPVLV